MTAHTSNKPIRVTMQDVARQANVTIGTVSHVINGTAKISAETTKRVNEAIQLLNYRPNPHAQALRKARAKSIGCLIPDMTTNFYANFVSSFVEYAYEASYSVSIINFQHNPKYEMAEIENLIAKDVDAILLYNGFDDSAGLEMIQQAGIPLILIDRYQEGCSCIFFNNSQTIQNLIHLLKASGHTKIGYLSESVIIQNLNDRYVGFITGMQKNGLETDIRNVLINRHPQVDNLSIGYRLMKERLTKGGLKNLPSVYIASSDLIAFGAMRAIREAGLSIPNDISIIGCDNLRMTEYVDPPLTTIQQSYQDVATETWKALCTLLENPGCEPVRSSLPQHLIIRKSAVFPEAVAADPAFDHFIIR